MIVGIIFHPEETGSVILRFYQPVGTPSLGMHQKQETIAHKTRQAFFVRPMSAIAKQRFAAAAVATERNTERLTGSNKLAGQIRLLIS